MKNNEYYSTSNLQHDYGPEPSVSYGEHRTKYSSRRNSINGDYRTGNPPGYLQPCSSNRSSSNNEFDGLRRTSVRSTSILMPSPPKSGCRCSLCVTAIVILIVAVTLIIISIPLTVSLTAKKGSDSRAALLSAQEGPPVASKTAIKARPTTTTTANIIEPYPDIPRVEPKWSSWSEYGFCQSGRYTNQFGETLEGCHKDRTRSCLRGQCLGAEVQTFACRTCRRVAIAVRDCNEYYEYGVDQSRITMLLPEGFSHQIKVMCEYNNKRDPGYIVIAQFVQDRQDLERTYDEYEKGFGYTGKVSNFDFSENSFFLGNQIIHRLTRVRRWKLKVDIQLADSFDHRFSIYNDFKLLNKGSQYRLVLGQIHQSSTATDLLKCVYRVPLSAELITKFDLTGLIAQQLPEKVRKFGFNYVDLVFNFGSNGQKFVTSDLWNGCPVSEGHGWWFARNVHAHLSINKERIHQIPVLGFLLKMLNIEDISIPVFKYPKNVCSNLKLAYGTLGYVPCNNNLFDLFFSPTVTKAGRIRLMIKPI